MPSRRWNPFAVVLHNQWRLPRVVHHATHVALGAPLWVAAHTLHLSLAWVIAATLIVAVTDKCIWIDWAHRECHWIGFHETEWLDFGSDLGLTLLGALLPPWPVLLPVYYALSVINGT